MVIQRSEASGQQYNQQRPGEGQSPEKDKTVITQGPAQAEHQQQRGDDIQRLTPLRQTRRDGNNH